jgi:electron transfer flavoprotein-quinone oxidoreductase
MASEFDAVVVGAGPAGSMAALTLAQEGVKTLLLERGEHPGAKNMFGGTLAWCPAPEEVLPGFWAEAPWEREVVKRTLTVVSERSATSMVFRSDDVARPFRGRVTLFRPVFDRWLAERAEDAGVTLACGCLVEGLVIREGRVRGVRVARPDGVVEAPLVVAADGALSFLAKGAGLHGGVNMDQMAVGIRALYSMEPGDIEERFGLVRGQGATNEFLGVTRGVRGGAFIYTHSEGLSVGLVLHLDSLKSSGLAPYDLLDRFAESPHVAPLLRGGRLVEYSAHLIPEAGLGMVPRLSMDGLMVVGDAAGLCYTNGLTQEGMNLALTSGRIAGLVAAEAVAAEDVGASRLSVYDERLRSSFVLRDMRTYDRAIKMLRNDRMFADYPRILGAIMDGLYASDGKPKRRVASLARAALRGDLPLRTVAADLIRLGRAYL